MSSTAPGIALLVFVALGGCSEGVDDGVVRASDIIVYAPLPGTTNAVAYLTLHNDSARDVEVVSVSSDEFATAELHATRITDNRSEMQALERLPVAAGASVVLEPGGMHVMLRAPRAPVSAGSSVTLRFHSPAGPLLELETTLQNRTTAPAADR